MFLPFLLNWFSFCLSSNWYRITGEECEQISTLADLQDFPSSYIICSCVLSWQEQSGRAKKPRARRRTEALLECLWFPVISMLTVTAMDQAFCKWPVKCWRRDPGIALPSIGRKKKMKEKRPWKSGVLEVGQGQPDPLAHNDDKPEYTCILFRWILGHFYETASMSRQKTDKNPPLLCPTFPNSISMSPMHLIITNQYEPTGVFR